MPFTLDDGVTTLTLKAKRVTLEERWRQKNIPLVDSEPYLIDLGLEMHDVEVVATVMTSTEVSKYYALKNPVEVTSSTYPEIEVGWWRLSERRSDRRPGWVATWELRFRLRRDYYHV